MEACTVFFVVLTRGTPLSEGWDPNQPRTMSQANTALHYVKLLSKLNSEKFPIGGSMVPSSLWEVELLWGQVSAGGWWVVCGWPGLLGQQTRFMLRLYLRQLGTHFFSGLVPGDAMVGVAEACILHKAEKPHKEVEKWDEEVWLSVSTAADTMVINYWFQTPVACIDRGTAVITPQQPQPAQTGLFFMPTRINNLLTVHKHTNKTSQAHLLIVNTH